MFGVCTTSLEPIGGYVNLLVPLDEYVTLPVLLERLLAGPYRQVVRVVCQQLRQPGILRNQYERGWIGKSQSQGIGSTVH